MRFWLLSVLRGLCEMLLLCLLAQACLWLLSGRQRAENPIYALFALLTAAPRRVLQKCLPAWIPLPLQGVLLVLLLAVTWLGIAFFRKMA